MVESEEPMSLLDVLRTGVRVANSVTRPLQPTVTYERYMSEDGYGAKVYALPVPIHAIEDWKVVQVPLD